MDTARVEAIENRIRTVWAREEALLAACLAILNYLKKHPNDVHHISFGLLKKIVGTRSMEDAEQAIQAAEYLAGPELKILEMKFEIIDGDEDDDVAEQTLDVATVKGFRDSGKFIDPRTGREDPELPKKLFLFFRASTDALEMFGEQKD